MNRRRMYDIFLAPHYSEKSTIAATENTFVFRVARDATKKEIRTAAETIFDVSITDVRTLNVKGKRKRTRYGTARHNNWKKAYIRVVDGQSISPGEQK